MIPIAANLIEQGLPVATVAGALGVSRPTLRRWLDEGSKDDCPDPLLSAFAAAVEYARTRAAEEGVRLMRIHAQSDYRAALELLKASDPETWSPAQRRTVDVSVKHETVEPDLSQLSDTELRKLQNLEAEVQRLKRLGRGE